MKSEVEDDRYEFLTKPVRLTASEKASKLKNEESLKEANYLVDVCHVPMRKVAKRLRINY